MNVEDIIRIAVLLSIMLIVLGFGLLCTWSDATSLFRNRGLLLRSLLAMNVILPLFAAALAALFTLRPVIEVVLIALAVSPVPPFLPLKQSKLVGHHEYIYGLLGATSLLTIVLAPATVILIGLIASRHASINPIAIARIVALTVLVPFALGLFLRRVKPNLAERSSPIASKLGMALLVIAVVPVLIKMWPAMIALVGDGTVVAIIAFIVVGLAAGHLLGGPDPSTRTVLALATATRHPGVALVIATANYPDTKLVAPAVLLYLLVSIVASTPYIMWRKRQKKDLFAVPPVA
jgi:BASS family bile acid:Na+ symporter